jgi:hypothetical protein
VAENDTTATLQCNFSTDNGIGWYDYLEFIEFGYKRLRTDSKKHTQFIDRTSTADSSTTLLEKTDPFKRSR